MNTVKLVKSVLVAVMALQSASAFAGGTLIDAQQIKAERFDKMLAQLKQDMADTSKAQIDLAIAEGKMGADQTYAENMTTLNSAGKNIFEAGLTWQVLRIVGVKPNMSIVQAERLVVKLNPTRCVSMVGAPVCLIVLGGGIWGGTVFFQSDVNGRLAISKADAKAAQDRIDTAKKAMKDDREEMAQLGTDLGAKINGSVLEGLPANLASMGGATRLDLSTVKIIPDAKN